MQLKLLLLAPVVIWSTVFPLTKLLLDYMPPTTLAAVRFSVGALCLMAYATYSCGWEAVYSSLRRRYWTFALLGGVGIFANNLLQNLGLARTAAGSASLLSTIDPLFTVILSLLFLGEKLNIQKAAGLMMSFLGVYLVVTEGQGVADWGTGIGNAFIILAAIGFSVYTVLSKRILHHEEPPIVVAWSTAFGAVLLALTALVFDAQIFWSALTTAQIGIIAYLAVIPTSLSVVMYFYLLQRVQASQAAVTLFLIPVFSVTWAVLLLGETITATVMLGGGLIIGGVWLTIAMRRTPLEV